MNTIEEKISKAASIYGNAHTKASLHLNRDVTPFDKHTASFNTYGLETAFEQGAKFALSHQWVSVEDGLPEIEVSVLVISVSDGITEIGEAWIGKYPNKTLHWFSSNDCVDIDYIKYWMPIPPHPEARKEDENAD